MIIYGKQIFLYILEYHRDLIEEVIFSKQIDSKLFHKVRGLNCPIINLDEKKAQAMARGGNHQGYFLKIKDIKRYTIADFKKYNFVIVLVGLTDMGNIGSIIRTAYSLGADGVIVSGIDDLKLPQVIRSSAGAYIDSMVVSHKDSSDVVNILKSYGYDIYATTQNGENLNNLKREGKIALLLGSEGDGLPNKLIKVSDKQYSISMNNKFDSLNVSNAAAIFINKVTNG